MSEKAGKHDSLARWLGSAILGVITYLLLSPIVSIWGLEITPRIVIAVVVALLFRCLGGYFWDWISKIFFWT